MTANKKIGLYFDTYDPPQNAILNTTNLSSNMVDEVWFVIDDKQSLENETFATYEERFEMLRLLTKENVKFNIISIDNVNNLTRVAIYNKLKEQYPNYIFKFIIDYTDIPKIKQWPDLGSITDKLEVISFYPQGFKIDVDIIKTFRTTRFYKTDNQTTSKEVREKVANSENFFEQVPLLIFEFINQNNLYK